jgi:hypothetical protein
MGEGPDGCGEPLATGDELLLLTNKLHCATGKSNEKPLITPMITDTKKWARMHSPREWGRTIAKTPQVGLRRIFALFCQSQLAGIIRAHPSNPWLVLLQPRPARGLLKTER